MKTDLKMNTEAHQAWGHVHVEAEHEAQERLSQTNKIFEYLMSPKSLKRFKPLIKSLRAKANKTRQY